MDRVKVKNSKRVPMNNIREAIESDLSVEEVVNRILEVKAKSEEKEEDFEIE